ncbi:MAG: histidine phosphatase family protein [Candidatus Thorarchaeota archaeon]
MSNSIFFLRHAETIINRDILVDEWIISEKGKKTTKEIIESGIFDDIDKIITSEERKAIQTAFFLAERLGKKIITNSDFNELKRGGNYVSSKKQYEKQVKKLFEEGYSEIKEWEEARSALRRITRAIDYIDREYSNMNILVVSHGIILSLYFNHLLGITKAKQFNRWKRMEFCGWGIVENKKVIKDIID